MKTSHRKAFLRSVVTSLLKYQRITTGTARAKEARRLAERLITLAKDDTVAARRSAYAVLCDRDLVGKLFKEITPLFRNRSSGYTRIIPVGFRRGDGAELCVLELTEKKVVEKLPKKKKKAKEEKPVSAEAQAPAAGGKAPEGEAPPEHKEAKKREPKIKTIPKSKPTLEEEKMAQKAKSEDKKLSDKRGFMKNLRGLFRKRGDF